MLVQMIMMKALSCENVKRESHPAFPQIQIQSFLGIN